MVQAFEYWGWWCGATAVPSVVDRVRSASLSVPLHFQNAEGANNKSASLRFAERQQRLMMMRRGGACICVSWPVRREKSPENDRQHVKCIFKRLV